MNHKQKFGYTLLGAGIMALGITIGQFMTPDIEAQSNGVFDKITCRELEVVDKTGKKIAFLGRGASSLGIKGNVFEIFDKNGKPSIKLSGTYGMNEVVIHDDEGDTAIRLSALGGLSSVQVIHGGKPGLTMSISSDRRSVALFDPLEKKDIEIDGYKIASEKEAFEVSVSNTRNELALWGKAPYKKGVGFYGDSNEATQITWNAR